MWFTTEKTIKTIEKNATAYTSFSKEKEKSGRERLFEGKRIYHLALSVSNKSVSLILVWFKYTFSKYVQSNLNI